MNRRIAVWSHPPVAAIGCALLLALHAASHAQTPPTAQSDEARRPSDESAEPRDAPRRLQSIDVTGKADPRFDSTVTKIVVDHDDIVRYGDTALSDVLKRLPGITIRGIEGQGSEIRMRGLGSGYVQILLDGEPVPRGFSLDDLSPELIERIEIQRVPTVDTSARGIAGTINIVLRKRIERASRAVKITVKEEAGRPGIAADAQVSDRNGSLGYTISGTAYRDERERAALLDQVATDPAGDVTQRWLTPSHNSLRYDSASLTPRAAWTAENGDMLTADGFLRYQRTRSLTFESTLTTIGAPPAYATNARPFDVDTTSARARLEWKHRAGDGALLDATFGGNYLHRYSDARLHALDAAGTFVLDRTVLGAATERGIVTNGKYTTPVAQGHAVAVGWDVGYGARTEYRRQHDVTFGGAPPLDTDENYDTRVQRAAVFAQDEWNITERWSAYGGLRFERIDTRVAGNVIETTRHATGVTSPVLQTLWQLPGSQTDQVRLGLARTYKAPSTFQLTPRRYIATNNTPTTPDYQGNADLVPELALGIDAAYEHRTNDKGLFAISAFARRIDDVIIEQLTNVNGIWITMPQNSGRAQVRGIEMEWRTNLRAFWNAGPDVAVHANLARNWSIVEAVPGPDNRLDRQTPASGTIGFDYTAQKLPLAVGASFSFEAGGRVRLAENHSERLPSERLLDAYAVIRVDPRLQLRLSFANVLHQDDETVLAYSDVGGTTELTTTRRTYTVVRLAAEMKF